MSSCVNHFGLKGDSHHPQAMGTPSGLLTIRDLTLSRDSSPVLQHCNCETPHQVFESARRIADSRPS